MNKIFQKLMKNAQNKPDKSFQVGDVFAHTSGELFQIVKIDRRHSRDLFYYAILDVQTNWNFIKMVSMPAVLENLNSCCENGTFVWLKNHPLPGMLCDICHTYCKQRCFKNFKGA